MKTCAKCGAEFPATPEYWHRHKGRRDGLQVYCKPCERARSLEASRRLVTDPATGEVIRAGALSKRRLVTDPATGETVSAGALASRRLVTDPATGETVSASALSNRKRRATEEGLEKHRAASRETMRKRWANGKIQEYLEAYLEANPLAKMRQRLSILIHSSMRRRGWSKQTKTQALLGCSFQEFKAYLEFQFTDGMSWENAGEWHYDHRIPCSAATSQEELEALFHWSNFQPMWGSENCSKSDTRPDGWALELRLLVNLKNT